MAVTKKAPRKHRATKKAAVQEAVVQDDKKLLIQAILVACVSALGLVYVNKYMNVYHVAVLEFPFVVYFFFHMIKKQSK